MTDPRKRWTDAALAEASRLGATYADVRAVARTTQSLTSRNGAIADLREDSSVGIGVRVIADGAWGFAAIGGHSLDAAREAVQRAVATARAAAILQPQPVALPSMASSSGSWETPYERDPFSVPHAERQDLLLRADRGPQGRVVSTTASTQAIVIEQRFANSEGAEQTQRFLVCGGGFQATAAGNGDVQVRSAPASFGGQWRGGGWEVFEALALHDHYATTCQEAEALLDADPCPTETTDLILEGSQLALQIHESVGHPLEADRFFGWEDAYAGGSYLSERDIGTREVAAPAVSIHANSTEPGGLGTFGWDDDGVAASQWDLIRDGHLRGALGNRELNGRMNAPSLHAASRAAGWNRLPLVRMVNVSMAPGSGTLDDLIGSTERGIYMQTNRSWSIDDRRLGFQFGCEVGWEIRDGQLGRMLKNPSYAGVTPTFWRSCDAIAGPQAYELWGFLICGKGQPGQMMMLSHGTSPARFRGVAVGGAYVDEGP